MSDEAPEDRIDDVETLRAMIKTLRHDLSCFEREYRATQGLLDAFHKEAMAQRPRMRAAAIYESALWHIMGGVWAIRKAYETDRALTAMERVAVDTANKIEMTVLDAVYLVPFNRGQPVRPFERAPKPPEDNVISWTGEDGKPVFRTIHTHFTTWPDLERQRVDNTLARFANGKKGDSDRG